MNNKGMSNRTFFIFIISAIVLIIYTKVTDFKIKDIPFSYVVIFFFIIVPLVTLAYCFKISKGG